MFRIKTLLFIIFILLISIEAYPDIYIEEKISTTISGRDFLGIKKTYITKNKTLLVDPTLQLRVIFDYNNNKVFTINDAKKDISISPLNNFILPINENFYSDFSNIKESDLYYKESENKNRIGNYDCYEIVIYIPKIAVLSRLWLTTGININLDPYFSFIENNSRDIEQKKIMQIMKEKKAVIVERRTTIVRPNEQERDLKIELIKISSQDIPENLFNLPEDYRKINVE